MSLIIPNCHGVEFAPDIILFILDVYRRAFGVIETIAALPADALLKFVHQFNVDVSLFGSILSADIPAIVMISVYCVPIMDEFDPFVPAFVFDLICKGLEMPPYFLLDTTR